jgi:arsenate reductase
MTTVLFACAHDAGRSQMAAAWFNLLADPARARAISAGTEPRTQVHPEVVTVTREVGVDLTAAPTTKLSDEVARQAQWVVTMACGDQCPESRAKNGRARIRKGRNRADSRDPRRHPRSRSRAHRR